MEGTGGGVMVVEEKGGAEVGGAVEAEEGVMAAEEMVEEVEEMVEGEGVVEGDMALFVCNSKPVPYCMKNSHNSTKKISS